jgi:hypothetical protein
LGGHIKYSRKSYKKFNFLGLFHGEIFSKNSFRKNISYDWRKIQKSPKTKKHKNPKITKIVKSQNPKTKNGGPKSQISPPTPFATMETQTLVWKFWFFALGSYLLVVTSGYDGEVFSLVKNIICVGQWISGSPGLGYP